MVPRKRIEKSLSDPSIHDNLKYPTDWYTQEGDRS
jgi:hypothetical protein